MKTILQLLGSVSAVLLASTAFGQVRAERVPPEPDLNTPVGGLHVGSTVVIRQSGSGNRAVVRQSARGVGTEVVEARGNTNSVEVRHDGRSTVVIEQQERPASKRPGPPPRKQEQ
ncbi:hypothetical protein F5984_25050 [Rudanella paleaurantiibacter]|uniref:DUF3060 domain-containing protein n=1 Tax=Rudanella paleaurantiibacter TaxID=2614655 RepID=A0A7J5TS98_9BACT|nr:hypothetical protein [Rudanella paleaurantiibacter]KAB7726148.1 hypothetical protein F5984_25050 [Rudanella paleaurantiibacter]